MSLLIEQIRLDLKVNSDPKTAQTAHRFFKEQIQVYGVKTAVVEKIAKKYLKQIRSMRKQELFALCEAFFQSGYMEEAFVVNTWLPYYIDNLNPEDIHTFKRWIETYVNNWAECDGLCNHAVGDLIVKCSEVVAEVKSWGQKR